MKKIVLCFLALSTIFTSSCILNERVYAKANLLESVTEGKKVKNSNRKKTWRYINYELDGGHIGNQYTYQNGGYPGTIVILAPEPEKDPSSAFMRHVLDPNGGSVDMEFIVTTKDVEYSFAGWAEGSLNGPAYPAEAEYEMKDRDITMFALFEPVDLGNYSALGHLPEATKRIVNNNAETKVILDYNYGDIKSKKQALTGTVTRTATFAFDGWWTEKNGGERVTEETVPTLETTYYAHWGNTTVSLSNFSRIKLPTLWRAGYSFAGWWTAPEGGEKVETTIFGYYTPTKSTTKLYAHWKKASPITVKESNGNVVRP